MKELFLFQRDIVLGLFSIFLHFQQLTENTCSVYLGSFHHSYTLQNFIIDIGFRYLKIVHDFTVKSHPPPSQMFYNQNILFRFRGILFRFATLDKSDERISFQIRKQILAKIET